ncbi:hypothetical protein SDC9_144030 [bioreactor metagenome]|uniref:Uncharacterized protein n=1 Tax=bioreactor metagenome TaxID=1076179 RepID=A0A645E5T0_9ZZZZ
MVLVKEPLVLCPLAAGLLGYHLVPYGNIVVHVERVGSGVAPLDDIARAVVLVVVTELLREIVIEVVCTAGYQAFRGFRRDDPPQVVGVGLVIHVISIHHRGAVGSPFQYGTPVVVTEKLHRKAVLVRGGGLKKAFLRIWIIDVKAVGRVGADAQQIISRCVDPIGVPYRMILVSASRFPNCRDPLQRRLLILVVIVSVTGIVGRKLVCIKTSLGRQCT